MQHLLSVDDMKESFIFDLWSKASDQKDGFSDVLKNKILTNLFYEPSTRTSSSFYSAMVRQGGSVIPINNVKFSSIIREALIMRLTTLGITALTTFIFLGLRTKRVFVQFLGTEQRAELILMLKKRKMSRLKNF